MNFSIRRWQKRLKYKKVCDLSQVDVLATKAFQSNKGVIFCYFLFIIVMSAVQKNQAITSITTFLTITIILHRLKLVLQ
jgi:hypothetical protein